MLRLIWTLIELNKMEASVHPTGELMAHEQQGTGDTRNSMENMEMPRVAASLLWQSQDFFKAMASRDHSPS